MPRIPFNDALYIDASDIDLARQIFGSFPAAGEAIIREAIITTNRFVKNEVVRQIIKHYAISKDSLLDSSKRARFTMTTTPPLPVGGQGEVIGETKVESNRLPLMRFQVDPTTVPNQLGVSVGSRDTLSWTQVRGQDNVGVPNRFVARMKSGHVGIYKRRSDAMHVWTINKSGKKARHTLNIDEMFGLSPSEMLRGWRIKEPLEKAIQTEFHKNLVLGASGIAELAKSNVSSGGQDQRKGGIASVIGYELLEHLVAIPLMAIAKDAEILVEDIAAL